MLEPQDPGHPKNREVGSGAKKNSFGQTRRVQGSILGEYSVFGTPRGWGTWFSARARIPYFTREFWLHNGAVTKTARLSSKNKLLARNILRLSSRMPLQVPVKGISDWAKIRYFTKEFWRKLSKNQGILDEKEQELMS